MALPDGRKSFNIGLGVQTQYRRVSDRHPDRRATTARTALTHSVARVKAVVLNKKHDLQEDNECEQDRHGHGDFLAGCGRQIKRDHAEYRYQHRRNDEVDGIEERLSAQVHRVVRPRVVLTGLLVDGRVDFSRYVENIPRPAFLVVRQIDLHAESSGADELFEKVLQNPHHVLHNLLSKETVSCYEFRHRRHNRELINKTTLCPQKNCGPELWR